MGDAWRPATRQGAGHTLKEAWSNLLGATVPAIAGQAQATRLDEARRLLLRADCALRAADWDAFGRAWYGLAARPRPALGFGRAVSLLARGAGTTFGGFFPGRSA